MAAPTIYSSAGWGIFDAETLLPAINYDTFISFKIDDNSTVSDFPVEDGAFATYNKVSKAFMSHVKIAVSDTPTRRAAFLGALRTARTSVSLMNLVTRDGVYLNATLESYAYARERRGGMSLITAELVFKEVRTVSRAYGYASVKPAGASKRVSSGSVSPTPWGAQTFLDANAALGPLNLPPDEAKLVSQAVKTATSAAVQFGNAAISAGLPSTNTPASH
jgi:hypothetical protein